MRTSLARQRYAASRSCHLRARVSILSTTSFSRCATYPHRPVIQLSFASSSSPKRKADVLVETARDDDTTLRESSRKVALDSQYDIKGIVPDLSTTRAIPLHLPDPPHDLAWPSSRSLNPTNWSFKYLFALGKAHLNLYKTGFKNVWHNQKTMRQITGRIGSSKKHSLIASAAYVDAPRITYNELEMVLRTKQDLKKLLPFGLIVAVCGEFTPLVILAFGSSVVPATCIIPKQEAQDLKKTFERHDVWAREMTQSLTRESQDIWTAYRQGMLSLSAARNPSAYLSKLLIQRAQKKRQQSLAETWAAAIAIQREGGWAKRSPQDMWDWGMKYGLLQLVKYARSAHERGEHPASSQMKEELLPVFDEETQRLVSIGLAETQSTGLRQSNEDSNSPDAQIQRADSAKSTEKRSEKH